MNKTISTLLGFMIGVTAGASVGILFAPREGRETRDKLTYRLDRTREQLRKLIEDIQQNEALRNVAQEESEKVTSEVKGKVEMLLSEVEDYIEKIQNEQNEPKPKS